MISKDELAELRAKLPRGSISKLCERTNLGRTTVYYALNGIRENDIVLEAAAHLIKEREAKKSEIRNLLQPIANPS